MGKVGGYIVGAVKVVAGVVLTAVGVPQVGVPLIISGVSTTIATALAPGLGRDGKKSSPTYGVAGAVNATREGAPKRIVLGKVRTPPAYVSAKTVQKGRKQYLRAAMYVCDGGPYGIQAIENVEINDQPVESYRKVTVTKLLGTSTQEAPKGFEMVGRAYTVPGVHLGEDDDWIYRTKRPVDEIAVLLVWRQGLYYLSSRDGMEPASCYLKVWVRVVNDDGSTGDWVKVAPGSSKMGDGWEQSKSGKWKVREKRRAPYHNLIRVTLRGSSKDVDLKLTAASRIEIRIKNTTGNTEKGTREPDIQQVEELVDDDRDYEGNAMLYIDALASEQLGGGFFKVTAEVSGWKCLDTRDSSTAWTRNPSVQLRQLLIEPDVGAGDWFSAADIDDDYAEDAADVCDENAAASGEHKEARFQCDGILDTFGSGRDWIDEILRTFRATMFEFGGKLRWVVDKARTFDRHFDGRLTPDAGTRPILARADVAPEARRPHIVEHPIEFSRRPNVVRVSFRDREDAYRLNFTAKLGESDLGTDEVPLEAEISLDFVTRATQAIREARYWLNRFRLRPSFIELGVSVGDLDLVYGDVVRVSADYPALSAVDYQVVETTIAGPANGQVRALICHANAYDDTSDSAPTKALSLTRSEALKLAKQVPYPAKSLSVSVVQR